MIRYFLMAGRLKGRSSPRDGSRSSMIPPPVLEWMAKRAAKERPPSSRICGGRACMADGFNAPLAGSANLLIDNHRGS